MVTVYGSGTTISCPKTVVAPPPVGQVITIGVAGVLDADADAVVGGASLEADGDADADADVLGAPAFCASAVEPPRWPRSTLPTRAPASASAPIRTPIRWFRFRRAARAYLLASADRRGGRRDPPPDEGPERSGRAADADRAGLGGPAGAVAL